MNSAERERPRSRRHTPPRPFRPACGPVRADPLEVVGVEQLLRRRNGIVDRFPDNRQRCNGHGQWAPMGKDEAAANRAMKDRKDERGLHIAGLRWDSLGHLAQPTLTVLFVSLRGDCLSAACYDRDRDRYSPSSRMCSSGPCVVDHHRCVDQLLRLAVATSSARRPGPRNTPCRRARTARWSDPPQGPLREPHFEHVEPAGRDTRNPGRLQSPQSLQA